MKEGVKHATTVTISWHYLLIPPLLFILLSLAFYYPSLRYNFQFDDVANITKHFAIRNNSLAHLFFTGPRWITFWVNSINYSFDKFNPYYYRLFNVLLHTCTALFLFYFLFYALAGLVRDSFFKRYAYPLALLSAAMFLLHPVQTQTVSYVIQGRLEGFAGFFVMLMALCFLRMQQSSNAIARTALGLLLFIAAFLSTGTKEIAIVGPALLLLTDWFFVAQGDIHAVKKRWWLHASIWLLVGSIYVYFLKPSFFKDVLGFKMEARNNLGNIITENPTQKIKPFHYFISEFKVIIHYLWIFLCPFYICVEYDWRLVSNIFAPDCLLPLLLLLAIAYTIIWLLRKNPAHPVAFGMLWFFIAIAPRSTIIPSPEFIVDYKTYIASPGFLLVIATALIGCWLSIQRLGKKSSVAAHTGYTLQSAGALLATVLVCGMGTWQRNKVWSSGTAFWGNIIANAPTKARAYNNYGVALADQGKYKEAIPYFYKAMQMDHHYADPLNNLAVACRCTGRLDEGIKALQQGIKLQPNYPEAYNNLASFLMEKRDFSQADKSLDLALRLRPTYGKAMYNKAKLYQAQAQFDKAWEWYKKACLEADFDNVTGFNHYALMSMQLRKYDDAALAYKKLLELEPTSFDHALHLADAHYLNKKYEIAYELYKKIEPRNPHDNRILHNIAETLWKLGHPEQAIPYFEQAVAQENCNPQTIFQYAACCEALGNPQKALTIISNAIKKPSLNAEWQNKMRLAINHLENKNAKAFRVVT